MASDDERDYHVQGNGPPAYANLRISANTLQGLGDRWADDGEDEQMPDVLVLSDSGPEDVVSADPEVIVLSDSDSKSVEEVAGNAKSDSSVAAHRAEAPMEQAPIDAIAGQAAETAGRSRDSPLNRKDRRMLDKVEKARLQAEHKLEKRRTRAEYRRAGRNAGRMAKRRKFADIQEPGVANTAEFTQHAARTGSRGIKFDVKKHELRHNADELAKIPFEDRPLIGVTSSEDPAHRDVMFARSAKPFPELLDALDRVVQHAKRLQVDVPKLFENCHQRGSRAQAIFGVDRPYSEDPKIRHSRKSKVVKESLEEFLLDKDLDMLNKHVELFVQTWFPGVHRRLFESNQKAVDNFKNRFGIFPLLAINLPFRENGFGATPHRDWKNPAGSVCVVLAGGTFESKDHHHLVLDDLGVSLEVPRGVLVAFPSSLITHYNHDFAEPVPDSRMSMVWFAQANLLMHREHGVAAAQAKKRSIRLKDENIKTIFRMSWS